MQGDAASVLDLTERGANANFTEPLMGATPLFAAAQEGHYADGDHVNQDSCGVVEEFEKPGQALLGVYDGHGPNGHLVSRATRDSLPDQITRLGKAGKNKK